MSALAVVGIGIMIVIGIGLSFVDSALMDISNELRKLNEREGDDESAK